MLNDTDTSTARLSAAYERLAGRLSEQREDLAGWFDQRYSLDDIIRDSVGPDTFRALRSNGDIRPSQVYRAWCGVRAGGGGEPLVGELDAIGSQAEYDGWLAALAEHFRDYYLQEVSRGPGAAREVSYGVSAKMSNLLMKRLVLWEELPDSVRERLISFLHLPLDSRIMAALTECARDSEFGPGLARLLRAPRMGLVRADEYVALQTVAQRVASLAKVPTIYIEILLWDLPSNAPQTPG